MLSPPSAPAHCCTFPRSYLDLQVQVLQLGLLSLFQGHQLCVRANEECEVGPAPALIQECFENYFMAVSSTDFDKGEGGS